MDAKYLAEIKAREQAATKGPWECNCYGRYEDHDECTLKTGGDEYEISALEDAEFISHARTDIPALVADNAAKDQQIATLKRALELAAKNTGRCGNCDQNCEFCALKDPEYYI